MKFSFTPTVLKDIQNMVEFVENFYILHELQVFRPICNVITSRSKYQYRNKSIFTREKRRNIVRQWFQYVVWANKIKKVLLDRPSIELIDLEIVSKKSYYSDILSKLRSSKDYFSNVDSRTLLEEKDAESRIFKIANSVFQEFDEMHK